MGRILPSHANAAVQLDALFCGVHGDVAAMGLRDRRGDRAIGVPASVGVACRACTAFGHQSQRTALRLAGRKARLRTWGHTQAEEQASEDGLAVTAQVAANPCPHRCSRCCRQFGVVAYIAVQQLDDRAFRFFRTDFDA
ncbi:MAG: hypothetical protein QOF88_7679 [Mycobacterium sp.]|nr:hypothetical protein [Mycobacterium sp.]